MNIAFVSEYDSADSLSWSGIPAHMVLAFEALGHSVERIGPLSTRAAVPSLVKRAAYLPSGRRYLRDRDPTLLRSYARQVERRLATSDCDVVFSPGTLPIAYARIDRPLLVWTDITFAGIVDFYPEFTNLTARTIREGNVAEQRALDACTVAVLSSEWAARATIDNYRVDPAKVRAVPFGANITSWPTRVEIERMVAARSREQCTLLFVGVDWDRKGGDIAFAVAEALNAAGVPTRLQVCGGEPSAEALTSPNVEYFGFVDKRTSGGRERFAALLADAHFLILPTRAEAFGVVLCEAGAFGVPCLVTEVGGTTGAVTSNMNGHLFPLDAPVSAWRDRVVQFWSDADRYAKLTMSSYDEFAGRLNWKTGCAAVLEMVGSAGA